VFRGASINSTAPRQSKLKMAVTGNDQPAPDAASLFFKPEAVSLILRFLK
jgi:hypothetical protein